MWAVEQFDRRPAPVLPAGQAFLDANAHVRHVDQRRGYIRCRADPDELTADVRVVDHVERPGAPATTGASFAVRASARSS
jgi:alkaline phosphatase D